MNIKFYLQEMGFILKKSWSDFIFLAVIYFLSLVIFSSVIQSYSYFSKLLDENFKVSYMKVFLNDDVERNEILILRKYAENNPVVSKVELISKERAKEEFAVRFPKYAGLLELFPGSPFPQNLEIKFSENVLGLEVIDDFVEFYSHFPSVTNVQHNYASALQIYKLKKSIFSFGTILFLAFLILYIPLNLSFVKGIFERESKLFFLVEVFGKSNFKLKVTFVATVAIPLIVVSIINLFVFKSLAGALNIPLYPVVYLMLFFLLLQILFSVDVLER
ncbi:MAG TPA: permease-like cell division protein FtsX [Candidatus Hydrothermia bacterium]|nr:permease-like cell division protein FtsX [Candidatus Hydrothermia bacterium]